MIPEYRKRGLAAAAFSKHYSKLEPLGAEIMTGGGDEFYHRMGYEDCVHWLHFRKRKDKFVLQTFDLKKDL